MRIRGFALWVIAFLILSTVTSLDRSLTMMAGSRPLAGTAQSGLLQYAREGLVLAFAGFIVLWLFFERDRDRRVTLPAGAALLAVALVPAIVKTIAEGYSFQIVAFGLRTFALAIIFIGVLWLSSDDRRQLLHTTARILKPFAVLQFGLAAYQIVESKPFFGDTFFGSRPWGTLSAPNNFSTFAVAAALVFLFGKPRHWPLWFISSLGFAVIAGSRSGALCVAVILGVLAVRNLKARALLLPIGGMALVAVLLLSSSEAVSGREISGEGRFQAWQNRLSDMTFIDVLLGKGVGLGTNAALSTYGYGAIEGAGVTDSQVFSFFVSFGLIGLACLAVGLVTLWRRGEPEHRVLYIPVIVVLATVYNVGEYAPANVLLIVVAACLSRGKRDTVSPSTSTGAARSMESTPA